MYFFASPTFDASLLFCLAKPAHLRCELMLAPPLSMVVGSSLTPREMKLLSIPFASGSPGRSSKGAFSSLSFWQSDGFKPIPKKDQPPEHHRKSVVDAIGKRFGQGAF